MTTAARPPFRTISIVSDGTPKGTFIRDAQTGAIIDCSDIQWSITAGQLSTAKVTFLHVPVNMTGIAEQPQQTDPQQTDPQPAKWSLTRWTVLFALLLLGFISTFIRLRIPHLTDFQVGLSWVVTAVSLSLWAGLFVSNWRTK